MLRAVDPTTGQIVRERLADGREVVEAKLAAAAGAFEGWRGTPFSERAALLREVARTLRARSEELALLMTEEMGKTVTEGVAEIDKCARTAEHFASHGEKYLRAEHLESDAERSYVQYLPLGTVFGILPWNSPFWLAIRVSIPALMAGNSCLLKPDPHVPGCGAALADTFRAAGAPPGLVEVLHLETAQAEGVLRDRRVAAVSFTGSSGAGAEVAAIAGEELKRIVLELGGSDPAIVLADADLERAAEVLSASRTICAGQSCIAAKRVLVEAPVYERFVALFEQRLAALRVGDPRDAATDVGPLARAELRDVLHRQVSESIAQGARCRLGGQLPPGPGCFYPVTLLTEVTSEMTAFREETFGPVAAVTQVSDVASAICLANRTEYGLAASIWTSAERAEDLARDIEAGQVVINGLVKTDPRLPSGGIKRSGYGRELGPHGIREFTNVQQVWVGTPR